ncbi:odorant receptor 22c-like isoform X2 [Harpegnathos saltator]|uniref:odorant receptor 22c-like isoform X2 n=1 Tax=Harpegnathos saltator TaxID=610380 RepID=UPI0009488ED0|nr:odorant receptor 22c-like isoform X2 [Harpegnathos saltator]
MMVTSTISPLLKNGLQLFGLWPDMRYVTVHQLILMSSILILQYFQYLYAFTYCRFNDLPHFVETLTVMFYYSLTLIKLTTLWTNRRVVREILAAIDSDWDECVNVNQHLHMMRTKASASYFCSRGWYIFNTFAGGLYFGGDCAMAMLTSGNNTARPFPTKLLLPFETEQSPVYEVLAFSLFLHGMLMVYIVATLNALICTLVLHASGQINIICEEIKTTSENMIDPESFASTTKMLIEKHNRIITFSENVDRLFSFIALMQVLSNTSSTCLLVLATMSVSIAVSQRVFEYVLIEIIIYSTFPNLLMRQFLDDENNVGLLKTIFAYTGMTTEIFIYCFVGEYLSHKSRSLADAAYESLWYNMSSNHGKDLLLVIMRSQKQLTITAGGMANLSLEAFTSIMKASASYISVLHAMC